jgi:hypothetical protein
MTYQPLILSLVLEAQQAQQVLHLYIPPQEQKKTDSSMKVFLLFG